MDELEINVKQKIFNKGELKMMGLMQMVAIYLMPILCIAFVLNTVFLAEKIKNGDEDKDRNTVWVAITFTLIVYSFMSVMIP
ncbi:hypothetical protein [Alkalibacillus almallahensis]|uniref:hypothetical protein n=1 Tax=Alkalibacillus almallahensis TaxID=1379154 RepID=UPI001420C7D1|nr:hypothetical protein [Alkalibacillus almallahensis]NIK12610.1 hypothetical protein [Alkalibacillus almallahensis]